MRESPFPPRPWSAARAGLPRWKVPFAAAEWGSRKLVHRAESSAVVQLLGLLGRLSVVAAIVSYVAGAPARRRAEVDTRKAKHYQAWQVINTALGHGGSGGRIDALQELNADSVRLAGVDVAHAMLSGLCLPLADLTRSRLDSADLSGADLRGTNLRGADLRGTILRGADLRGANLLKARLALADLREADLRGTDLAAARLDSAFLQGARLDFADLDGASLVGARLGGARFRHAVLIRSDLRGAEGARAEWDYADLSLADLRGARMGEPSELARASVRGANVAGMRTRRSLATDTPTDLAAIGADLDQRGAVRIEEDARWRSFVRATQNEVRGTPAFRSVWDLRHRQPVNVDTIFPRSAAATRCTNPSPVELPRIRE